MTRALTMVEAAESLRIGVEELRALIKKHPHYEPRSARLKTVFYPEHIRRLEYIIRPPVPASAIEAIRSYVGANVDDRMFGQFEEFWARDFTGQVYILRCNDRVKIGFTTHWTRRLRVLRTACPHPVTVIAVFAGDRIFEQVLHAIFTEYRRHGEWFEEAGGLAELVSLLERVPVNGGDNGQ